MSIRRSNRVREVRQSARLQNLYQDSQEKGKFRLAPADVKARQWHKVEVQAGHFTVQRWLPRSQDHLTPELHGGGVDKAAEDSAKKAGKSVPPKSSRPVRKSTVGAGAGGVPMGTPRADSRPPGGIGGKGGKRPASADHFAESTPPQKAARIAGKHPGLTAPAHPGALPGGVPGGVPGPAHWAEQGGEGYGSSATGGTPARVSHQPDLYGYGPGDLGGPLAADNSGLGGMDMLDVPGSMDPWGL